MMNFFFPCVSGDFSPRLQVVWWIYCRFMAVWAGNLFEDLQ